MKPLVIGIAGGTGSGKTSVTNRIVGQLASPRISVIQHDSYYRDLDEFSGRSPAEVNFDHPDALETDLLIRHVRMLRSGSPVEQPTYDFSTYHRLAVTRRIEPTDIVIVEGILIFVEHDLRELMDIKIFVDTDADERFIRRLRRDIAERGRSPESVIEQYLRTVKPMHLQFVEPSKQWADVIIPRGAENNIAIDMVVARIGVLMKEAVHQRG